MLLETTNSHERKVRRQLEQACEWFGLTPRQRDIVWAIFGGLTESADIASAIGIASPTVKIHLGILYERLGVSDRLGVMLRLLGKPIKEDYRTNG